MSKNYLSELMSERRNQLGRKPSFSQRGFSREYNALIVKDHIGGHTQKKTFAPSTVGYGHGKCPRYWYYAFKGVHFDDHSSPKSKIAMKNGTTSHERMQEVIKDMSIYKSHEDEIRCQDPPIRGFVDLIFEIDGKIVVGDIKTVPSIKFHYVKTVAPQDSHIIQTLIYMKLLDTDEGFILYENRDDFSIHIHHIFMSDYEGFVDKLFDWMREVYQIKELPVRAFTKTSSECRYCPVFDQCYSDSEGSVEVGGYPTI